VPLANGVESTGGLDVKFSKPIAIPPSGQKKKLVKLVMENKMCELSLISHETGEKIIGKPSFDENKFKDAG
jgi:hypothetical protein